MYFLIGLIVRISGNTERLIGFKIIFGRIGTILVKAG